MPSTKLRDLVRVALATVGRYLPDALPAELDEPLTCDAIAAIHFPRDEAEAEAARRRLALDELFTLQLVVARSRDEDAVARALPEPGSLIGRYRDVLPFELTQHQERAIAEIDLDLARTTPMPRLLQGDVGSGRRWSRSTHCCARSRARGKAH